MTKSIAKRILGNRKLTNKKVLKKQPKLVVTIKEHKSAEYEPIYFKDEIEKEKKLFFS